MDDVLLQVENGNIYTTSLLVAEKFKRRHWVVVRDIDNLISELEGVNTFVDTPMFIKSEHLNQQNGQSYPMYLINRDGFSLLVMGFNNTRDVLAWKLKYIEAFNAMEEKLHSYPPQLPDNRLEVAKIIAKTPVHSVAAIRELYPEYFAECPPSGVLERASALMDGMKKWIDTMGITLDWIESTPTTNIYLTYSEFCKDYHVSNMGKKTFFKAMSEEYGLVRAQRSDGFRYFVKVK